MIENPDFHIHLVSDSTGETIASMSRACRAQFENVKIAEHIWSLIRSPIQLDLVFEALRSAPGPVFFTLIDEKLRSRLEEFCYEQKLVCVSVLDPILKALALHLNRPYGHTPGRQHRLNDEYFARIEAMEFAIAFDDGHSVDRLNKADVLLLGVSRTSKTPTCLYLAGRGIRAANIPLVPGRMPPDLHLLKETLVVGLTREAESLASIRAHRLPWLQDKGIVLQDYADPEAVRAELLEARRYFTKIGCPVIDVTRRSIEETAAEIMTMLSRKLPSI